MFGHVISDIFHVLFLAALSQDIPDAFSVCAEELLDLPRRLLNPVFCRHQFQSFVVYFCSKSGMQLFWQSYRDKVAIKFAGSGVFK